MGLIERSAYFEVCPHCGLHGSIVLAAGGEASPLCSKVRARAIAYILCGIGELSQSECDIIIDQISASSLPDSESVMVGVCDESGGEDEYVLPYDDGRNLIMRRPTLDMIRNN